MVLQPPGQVLNVSEPRRAAVLGSPISHSLSPALHRAAYRALGLGQWSYEAHEVKAPALRGFVAGLGPQWAGLSLTMPLKEAAFEVADECSDLAREVGAVNTLYRGPDGRGWRGDNTDVYGVSQALREAGCEHVASAVLLGSGATARAVVAALVRLGCTRVSFAVRSAARPQTLDQARRAGLEVDVVGLGRLAEAMEGAQVVVSTLPADALPADALPADALPADALPAESLPHEPARNQQPGDDLPGNQQPGDDSPGNQKSGWMLPPGSRFPDHLFLDVVYAGWPTPLARTFQEAGASVVPGLEMLVHQGAEQVYLMTGQRPPVDQMRSAGLAAMADLASR
jgi:shikimate dehydrogenase